MPNNYETDLIFPIVAAAARLAGLDYAAASPKQRAALKVPRPYPLVLQCQLACVVAARLGSSGLFEAGYKAPKHSSLACVNAHPR